MADAEFRQFLELPYEIRAAIWELCLPHRVQEVESPRFNIRWPYHSCTLFDAHMANRRPPAISRVCQESRKIAQQAGQPHHMFNQVLWNRFPYAPDQPRWGGSNSQHMPVDSTRYRPIYDLLPGVGMRHEDNALWVLPGRSVLHLNYTADYSFEDFLDWAEQEPVGFLQWYARQLRAPIMSISADLVLPFCENYLRLGPACDMHNVRALRRFSSYAVVVLHVPLHLTSPTAARQSGLFGLLGDAPLQLVDPRTDWDYIEQLKTLWRAHSHSNDRDAFRAFEVVLASQEGFAARCQNWLADLKKVWVNYFHTAIDDDGLLKGEEDTPGFSERPDKDSVWMGSNDWDEQNRDVDWDEGHIAPTRYLVDLETRSLNLENMWVQAQLAQMPVFVPHILFRYCDTKCYLPKEERPGRPI
ncbi:hypothetical protein SEUCBS139899_005923 [Sporothrix eucalyptigena]|uniref:2EXR domain-containing protein n=1 Tax=Sporothrix eucalyptigena TaxID=1812306 RepID=A0ABP0AXC4_9PEZI